MFEFAGGEQAFLAFATAFHERCLEDPELNHPFSQHSGPGHVDHLARYWAEVFGGPTHYSESLGGHSGMLGIHAGQGASEDLSVRFVACFMHAADDADLPGDRDFRAALRSYIEWAVKEVDGYQPPGSLAPAGLPMPRWGWSGQESGAA